MKSGDLDRKYSKSKSLTLTLNGEAKNKLNTVSLKSGDLDRKYSKSKSLTLTLNCEANNIYNR